MNTKEFAIGDIVKLIDGLQYNQYSKGDICLIIGKVHDINYGYLYHIFIRGNPSYSRITTELALWSSSWFEKL